MSGIALLALTWCCYQRTIAQVLNAGILSLIMTFRSGAVLFLFRVRGKVYLHTGDFRFCQTMREYPELKDLRVDGLYLDTTFLNPSYDFPPQQQALSCVERIIKREVIASSDSTGSQITQNSRKTLFLIGTYQIGKEKVIEVAARAAAVRVFVTPEKCACRGASLS
jgi:Cft2 family RNA processing exonuclease